MSSKAENKGQGNKRKVAQTSEIVIEDKLLKQKLTIAVSKLKEGATEASVKEYLQRVLQRDVTSYAMIGDSLKEISRMTKILERSKTMTEKEVKTQHLGKLMAQWAEKCAAVSNDGDECWALLQTMREEMEQAEQTVSDALTTLASRKALNPYSDQVLAWMDAIVRKVKVNDLDSITMEEDL